MSSTSPHAEIKSISFPSKDGTRLHALMGLTNEHKAAVLIFHGMQSHSEWHLPLIKALNKIGIDAMAFDRRGSGKSEGLRGHYEISDQLIEDAQAAFAEFKKHIPKQTSKHVYATSYGYLSSVPFLTEAEAEFKSFMLVVPAVASAKTGDYPLSVKAKILLSPKLKKYDPPYPTPAIAGPGAVEVINADPLVVKSFTAQFLRNTLFLRMRANREFKNLKLPTLVVGAREDKIVDTNQVKQKLWKNNPSRVTYYEFPSEHDVGKAGFEQELSQKIGDWVTQFF